MSNKNRPYRVQEVFAPKRTIISIAVAIACRIIGQQWREQQVRKARTA